MYSLDCPTPQMNVSYQLTPFIYEVSIINFPMYFARNEPVLKIFQLSEINELSF